MHWCCLRCSGDGEGDFFGYAHIPRHQRQRRTFSRAQAQRRGRGWGGRARPPWAKMARCLAEQWQRQRVQGALMAMWAQAAVVAAGTRAVAGHYHRRRDASTSGSTRDRASCTRRSPCRAHWKTSVRRRSHRCTGSGCSRGASGRRTTGSPPSDTYRTPQSCRCLQCTRSPPRRRSKC